MHETTVEISRLGGRLRKTTLPVFSPPIPSSPPPKRLLLPQGELAHCYDGVQGMQYIAFLELLPGSVRGNHYHRRKQEWLYVASGEIELRVEEMESKKREALTLKAGEMGVIDCGLAHAFRTLAPGCAVEFSPTRFDPADSYRFDLV